VDRVALKAVLAQVQPGDTSACESIGLALGESSHSPLVLTWLWFADNLATAKAVIAEKRAGQPHPMRMMGGLTAMIINAAAKMSAGDFAGWDAQRFAPDPADATPGGGPLPWGKKALAWVLSAHAAPTAAERERWIDLANAIDPLIWELAEAELQLPFCSRRQPLDAALAHLARTWSWKTILEETDVDLEGDLTRQKLRAFALYVRRDRLGHQPALDYVRRLRAAPDLTPVESFYLLLLEVELALDGRAPAEEWVMLLAAARRLAGKGAIVEREDYDQFIEAAHRLELANKQVSPPAGAALERLGFWSSLHLRTFLDLPAGWALDPKMGFG
jgi:hypothetical protein